MSVSEVTTLYNSNYRDPVATLRHIADEIELGTYGAVGSVALVVMGDTVEVFGSGLDSDPTSVACLLQAGAMRLVGAIERHGRI